MDNATKLLMATSAANDAETAIIRRLHQTCYAVDGSDLNAWLDCFTTDGVFSWAPSEGAPLALDVQGARALARWFEQHRSSIAVGTQTHLLLQPVINVAGYSARALSTYLTLRNFTGEIGIASSGRYVDDLILSENGVWRFVSHAAIGGLARDPSKLAPQ
jgi:hypothetical protein